MQNHLLRRKNFPFKNRKKNQPQYSWILQRPWTPDRNLLTRPPQYDFDAWLYIKPHPQQQQIQETENENFHRHEKCHQIIFPELLVAAEDIKFAFNCYNFLRVCRYFGLDCPSVVGSVSNCTPPMSISARGNRIFYMNCEVNKPLREDLVKVGLTAHPSKGMCIKDVDWKQVARLGLERKKNKLSSSSSSLFDWREAVHKKNATKNLVNDNDENSLVPREEPIIQLVVGMENGMSDHIAEQCDFCVHIPQFGSIGSLSMINALSVGIHDIFTGLHGRPMMSMQQNSSSSSSSFDHKNNSNKDDHCQLAICQGPDTNNEGKLYPHSNDLLGHNDATINHTLAVRRNELYSLQLSLVWWNALGDRNIGASIRNANIYNVEHMIVLNRKKYSRRGTVGCHHYVAVHHLRDMDEVGELGLLDGYEMWALVNDYPYLCNYDYAEKNKILDYNLLCGHEEASKYPEESGETLASSSTTTTIYLDDEEQILEQLQKAKSERNVRGIALVIPDEGSSCLPHLEKQCTVRIRMVNPKNFTRNNNSNNNIDDDVVTKWKEYQAGLPGSLSTTLVLDRLRNMIDIHFRK